MQIGAGCRRTRKSVRFARRTGAQSGHLLKRQPDVKRAANRRFLTLNHPPPSRSTCLLATLHRTTELNRSCVSLATLTCNPLCLPTLKIRPRPDLKGWADLGTQSAKRDGGTDPRRMCKNQLASHSIGGAQKTSRRDRALRRPIGSAYTDAEKPLRQAARWPSSPTTRRGGHAALPIERPHPMHRATTEMTKRVAPAWFDAVTVRSEVVSCRNRVVSTFRLAGNVVA